MKETWRPLGSSDPLTYTCTCPISSSPVTGLVLLFYRYFASAPPLPSFLLPKSSNASELASFHASLTQALNLSGKIRIAKEGFNITVAGTSAEVEKYMDACMAHWSFAGLEADLGTADARTAFFKPSPGCACVFGSAAASSVRVCAEITPMGVTDYVPSTWDIVESLSPPAFHERCWEAGGRKVLVDVRNHYESRIGYFIDPRTQIPALRPGVRRFGQWPQFVKRNMKALQKEMDAEVESGCVEGEVEGGMGGTQYLTYCTGGIRCEKGSRFLAENLVGNRGDSVCTLKGGIQAYLMWMDSEIAAGRKQPSDSLFKGKNYVFDARGSTRLSAEMGEEGTVADCHVCGRREDRLSKCRSTRCHLILVVCEECEEDGGPRCCEDCGEIDANEESGPRPICQCEQDREFKLWGDRTVKPSKTQGSKPGTKTTGIVNSTGIQIKLID